MSEEGRVAGDGIVELDAASMEPRSNERGRARSPGRIVRVNALQWSLAPMSEEGRRRRRVAGAGMSRFNGASLQ